MTEWLAIHLSSRRWSRFQKFGVLV